jgi:hypothetical protein
MGAGEHGEGAVLVEMPMPGHDRFDPEIAGKGAQDRAGAALADDVEGESPPRLPVAEPAQRPEENVDALARRLGRGR